MEFSFKAKIYKVGINLCVKVPEKITRQMQPVKGYIPVRGTINGFEFLQTLCPVKGAPYRLYVNGIMLKGSGKKQGDTAEFIIQQNDAPRNADSFPMPKALKQKLSASGLLAAFKKLSDYRRKEILRYLNHLKTEEAMNRNIDKIVAKLQNQNATRLP